ncbi:MAG: hypothetical protein JO348_07195 [Alphaproteobacteria bacterium]|nr:hypothetical protein [Alphaproteobacteria bacterium]
MALRRALCAAAVAFASAGAAGAVTPVPSLGEPAVNLAQSFSQPQLSYGPAAPGPSNLVTSASLVSGLDLALGYKVDLTGHIDPFDASDDHTFDGLFLGSVGYSTLGSGGNFFNATTALADDLHVSVGYGGLDAGFSTYTPDAYSALIRVGGPNTPYNPRSASSLLAGVSWDFAKWGSVGMLASRTSESDGVLGFSAPGADAHTAALGVSAKVHFGNGWVTTASYSEGITQLDLKPGINPTPLGDELRTRSFGIAIAKNGLFGDDSLGLAVSRPALGVSGGDFITLPGSGGRPAFFGRNHLLEGAVPETDLEIGYVTTFLDGAVALQTNASYQLNSGGQTDVNAVSLLSRARIKF